MTLAPPEQINQSFKSYRNYTHSGFSNLGRLPTHWTMKRLKFCAKLNMGQSPSSEDCNLEGQGLPFLQGTAEFSERHPQPRFHCHCAAKVCRSGDILISVRAPVGDLNIADQDYGIGRGLCAISPTSAFFQAGYPWYALHVVREQLKPASTGTTYEAVATSDVADILLPIPSHDEQRAIVAFLDRETARIDAMIEKKERLIALLEEKRTALISHAVTKGLDPTAPKKDSGIPWLGEIPAHWDVKRLKHITQSIQTGPFGSQLHAEDYVEDGIPVINPSNIVNGTIVPDPSVSVPPPIFDRLIRHELKQGDVVFARRGEMGRCGLVNESEDGWLCGTGSLRIRFTSAKVHPHYLHAVLSEKGIKDELLLASVGSTMDNLNTAIVSQLQVPLPPVNEQVAIMRQVRQLREAYKRIVEANLVVIRRMGEFRSALISAAVTGKIDVRHASKDGDDVFKG